MKFMKRLPLLVATLLAAATLQARNPHHEELLTDWQFRLGHDFTQHDGWQPVTVPHDWAISGPF